MGTALNLTGRRFGRLTVISRAGSNGYRYSLWLCRCDCGTEKVVIGVTMSRGDTVSCGCYRLEQASTLLTTHGQTKTPEFRAWHSMRQRCCNPKDKSWKHYGGRGIKVCERWIDSFPAFLTDMGRRPSQRHSIDRRDNNGNYTPDNCRWETPDTQMRNRSNVHLYEFNGRRMCLPDWASALDIPVYRLRYRIKQGRSLAEVIADLAPLH